MSKADEVFEKIAAKLITAIEGTEQGTWSRPWQTVLAGTEFPKNALTGKQYQGMNALYFWILQAEREYPEARWGTYKQWKQLGEQVAKGEKGTQGVKWGTTYVCEPCGAKGASPCKGGHINETRVWASVFYVFNIAQTEGYEAPIENLGDGPEKLANVERMVAATGATIEHRKQNRAYYSHATDIITVPVVEQFETQQGYYGTLLHELTHWTGHETRLGRDAKNVFGSAKYAAEELVAEMGAAMLAAQYGVEIEPHVEHVAYLQSWVEVIRSEKMALYRAAKLAHEAARYLVAMDAEGEGVVAA